MIGQTISHYQITKCLGAGGMGVVYQAEDTRLKRLVALKFLTPQALDSQDIKTRFVREAQAAAALDHPNICTVYEIDEADGQTFIVMALIDGISLRERIQSGPLPLDEALDISIQIVKGLQAAHQRGIVHRDVKSANVMLSSKGQVKVTDFGLAKLSGQTRLTQTGATVGTVAYMSPEQARGEAVDARADIFSSGVVLYEMLTGVLPFKGEHTAALIYAISHEEPKPLSEFRRDLPKEIQSVLDRALAKDPQHRFQSAEELLVTLESLRAGKAVRLPVAATRKRRLRLALGLLAAVALIIIGLVASKFLGSRGREERSTLATGLEHFVVAVTPFWGQNAQAAEDGRVMQALVARRIDDVLGEEDDVRLIAEDTSEVPRFHSDARALGEKLGATLVVWGDVLELRGEIEIQPYVTVTKPIVNLRDRSVDALEVSLTEPDQLTLRKSKAEEAGNMALLVAATYFRNRDPERALTLLDRVSPPTCESLRQKGSIHFDRKAWQQAELWYREAIALDPEDPAPYVNLALVFLLHRQYDDAIEMCQRAVELDPQDPATLHNLGWGYARIGEYDQAEISFEKAIEIDPNDAEAHNGLGWTYHGQKMWEEAEAEYRKAMDLDPSDGRPHNNLGWAYYQQGRIDEALAEYDRALAVDSTLAWPYNNLGWHYFRQGHHEEAIPLYERAIALDPLLIKPRANLGYLLFCMERFDEAIDVCQRIIAIDSTVANPYGTLGGIYLYQGNCEKAITSFEKSAALSTTSTVSLVNLGKAYSACGNSQQAISTLVKAIELKPHGYPDAYYSLGEAYDSEGRFAEAAEAFRQAAELDPDDLYFHVNYFMNLFRSGDIDEARKYIANVASNFEGDDIITHMAHYYAGYTSEDSVLSSTTDENPRRDREKKCEAYYYLGMAHLLGVRSEGPDRERARSYFERCVATDVKVFTEYMLAERELNRLE